MTVEFNDGDPRVKSLWNEFIFHANDPCLSRYHNDLQISEPNHYSMTINLVFMSESEINIIKSSLLWDAYLSINGWEMSQKYIKINLIHGLSVKLFA